MAVLSFADCLATMRPDVLLLIADRYEMLAPAAVALALRIPIAHIEGGEISRGAIDDAVRNALTKMSHIHFTSTEGAKQRVVAMGEEPWRVYRAGAPSLDHLSKSILLSKSEVERKLQIDLTSPTAVVAYHPVTLLQDTNAEAEELFAALARTPHQLIFCHPNADAGSRDLREHVRSFLAGRGNGHLVRQLTCHRILEPASVCRADDRQLQQRHHGICIICSADRQRRHEAAGAGAGAQCAGRGADCRVDSAAGGEGYFGFVSRIALGNDESLWRGPRRGAHRRGTGNVAVSRAAVAEARSWSVVILNIPLSEPDITESEIEEVVSVLRAPRLSLGPKMEEFEELVCRLTGQNFGIAVSSGTTGLHLCIRALGIGAGDEVIVPSFTFVAAANAVRYEGATPVFVDIEPRRLNIDADCIEAAITSRTRAIFAVHTFGCPADMQAILEIARRHRLFVMEDACEAIGAMYRGKPVGSFGDAAVFAFYPNKQITTGEGGMVVTGDRAACAGDTRDAESWPVRIR